MLGLKEIFGTVLPQFTFVDVGAMSLGSEPYAPLVNQGIGRVIGFEPVAEECDKLNILHRNSSHLFLPYAIGDGSSGVFNTCNYPMTSSLFIPNSGLVDRFTNLGELMQVVSSENIMTRKLDDISEIGDADYLKMDVQGAELQILKGGRKILQDVMIVHTEVEFVPLYAGQPLFADIDAELRAQGFLFHRFLDIKGCPFKPFALADGRPGAISQQLWADAVYVKDFTRFDELQPRKLLKLAIMLHELYHSFDLSAEAVKEFDNQSGFNLYQNYCHAVTS